MEEVGLKEVYENKTMKLKEMITEFVGEAEQQYERLVYLALFMCCGKDEPKAKYLCTFMNNMDVTKTEVSGEKFRAILEDLMRLSIKTIPEKVGKEKMEECEKMMGMDMPAMVKLWCKDCTLEVIPQQTVIDWVAKSRCFTTCEARAAVLECIKATEKQAAIEKARVEAAKASVPKEVPKTEKVPT